MAIGARLKGTWANREGFYTFTEDPHLAGLETVVRNQGGLDCDIESFDYRGRIGSVGCRILRNQAPFRYSK